MFNSGGGFTKRGSGSAPVVPGSAQGGAAFEYVEDSNSDTAPQLVTSPFISTLDVSQVPLLDYYRGLQANCATPAVRSALTAANRVGVSGVDVIRRQDRGTGDGNNLFVEPARTVYLPGNTQMASAPWAPLNGGTTAANNQLVSPSGAVDATLLTFGASAVARLSMTSSIGTIPVNKDITFSVWAKINAGSGKLNLNVTDHDGTPHASGNFTTDGFWRLYSFTTISGTNPATTMTIFIGNGGDNTAHSIYVWGAQMDLGKDTTSTILTASSASSGTSVLGDVYQTNSAFVSLLMRTGRWTINVWLSKAIANLVSGDRFVLFSFVSASNRIELSHDGTDVRFRVYVGGVQVAKSPVVTGAAYALQTLVFDAFFGTVKCNGVAGPAGTPWIMPQGVVGVGVEVAGAAQWSGEMGQPFAA